jgi:hypothetical protein
MPEQLNTGGPEAFTDPNYRRIQQGDDEPRHYTELEVATNLLQRAATDLKAMRQELHFANAQLRILNLVERLTTGGGMQGVAIAGTEWEIERWLDMRKQREEREQREQRVKDAMAGVKSDDPHVRRGGIFRDLGEEQL